MMTKDDLLLYRKRLIPQENIPLKNDEILYLDDTMLITKWITLKPRPDFHHGYSCYFLKDGIKVSKFYKSDGSLLYWYCDIISPSYDEATHTLTVTDLLADVILTPEHNLRVLDVDELSYAHEHDLITDAQFFAAVKQLGFLLAKIENGTFFDYVKPFEDFIS